MEDGRTEVRALRNEFWRLDGEAPRPRGIEAVKRDLDRQAEIKAALAALGTDVGQRPSLTLPGSI